MSETKPNWWLLHLNIDFKTIGIETSSSDKGINLINRFKDVDWKRHGRKDEKNAIIK